MFRKRNFLKDTGGTVAVNFALVLTAVVAIIGASIDLSLINSQKSKMQNLADSTALAAAVSGNKTLPELQLFAEEFLKSSTLPDANVLVKLNNGNVLVELTKTKELMISKAFPGGSTDLFADSEVPLPGSSSAAAARSDTKNFNIALVLDSTGSMISRQKLDHLKIAAVDFITDMEGNASPNSMVGLVPFSTYVKLPTSYKDKTWLEAPALWEGCMQSRKDGFHKTPDFESRRLQGFTTGDTCGDENSEVLPLSTNLNDAKDAVRAMSPEGATYIPAGLIWGWRMLSPNTPLEEASQNPNAKKVLILLTDGQNTNTIYGEDNSSKGIFHKRNGTINESQGEADILTAELCESIKADGIRIITIPFALYNSSSLTMLQTCASSPEDYHRAYNNSQLLDIFSELEGDLISEEETEENVVRLLR